MNAFRPKTAESRGTESTRRRALPTALAIGWMFLLSCTPGEITRTAQIAVTGDVASAHRIAVEKTARYASNPKQFERDMKRFAGILEAFRKAITGEWGDDEAREPTPRIYVKYTQNYRSRAMVNFDTGLVTVETVDWENPQTSLKNAIVTTLLIPYDPRAVDLYTDTTVKLGETPFLYKEVLDHDRKAIRWSWRAERYADHLMANNLETRNLKVEGKERVVHSVQFPMVKDHLQVRAKKYRDLVKQNAKRFNISGNLIYAVIKTESNFNPYAVSHAPAFGLMQIVPKTAGRDVNRMLGRQGTPSPASLMSPSTNIEYGTAYLHLLDTEYLERIGDPLSREYCMIAAYNAGSGTVLRTFDRDRERAADRINSTPPLEVFRKLRTEMPSKEGRRYLGKVIEAKKQFVNF